MCDLGDADRADVWRRTWHRASKPYRCSACGALIPRGVRYETTFVVSDGLADSAKTCRQCARAIERFGRAHRFWPFPDSFREFLEECVVKGDEGERWRQMLNALNRRAARAREAA